MASYLISENSIKQFRFFEERNWFEDEDQLTNEYFKFSINHDDIKMLGFTYAAHINLWFSVCENRFNETKYQLSKYRDAILKDLEDLAIENDPPNFGYDNPDLKVEAFSWKSPSFKIIDIDNFGVKCKSEDLDIFYFDLNSGDMCSKEDFDLNGKKLKKNTIFSIDPGDPVFMDDYAYNIVQQDFKNKIKQLNIIYTNAGFKNEI